MQHIRCQEKETRIEPFDSEIVNDKLHRKNLESILTDSNPQEYFAFGLSKGTLIIANISNLAYIYSRVTVARSPIVKIEYMHKAKVFVSICQEMRL